MIRTLLAALFAKLVGDRATAASGALGTAALAGSVVSALAWVFGPGRTWKLELDGSLEIAGAGFISWFLIEWIRRQQPPAV